MAKNSTREINENTPLIAMQVADHFAECFLEIPTAGAVKIKCTDLATKITENRPVFHGGFGNEMPVYMGIDQEDIKP